MRKISLWSLLVIIVAATVFICIAKPVMHKQFSFNVIEYILKFNKDGSVSTTKTTTINTLEHK